ncbi:unnamed protein product, partial [Rotaria sordida]
MAMATSPEGTILLSGSSAEGQYEAKFCSSASNPENDFMITLGEISKQEQLLPNIHSQAFVRVEVDQTDLKNIDMPMTCTSDDKICIDGMGLKQNVLQLCQSKYPNFDFHTSVEQASIQGIANNICQPEHILSNIAALRKKLIQKKTINNDKSTHNDLRFEAESLATISESSEAHLPNKLTDDVVKVHHHSQILAFSMLGAALGIPMHKDYVTKIKAVLDYYQKYKHRLNKTNKRYMGLKRIMQRKVQQEFDFVPALELKFVPDIILPFHRRLKKNRPDLYKKIRNLHLHVIPKWSKLTDITEANTDFRYSFSAYEIELAKARTKYEQVLNNVARGLFYKHLYKNLTINDQYLPSYFIKTTVLWMCEECHIDRYVDTTDDEDTISLKLGQIWINYTCHLLRTRYCPHYFIFNMNLLENYPTE